MAAPFRVAIAVIAAVVLCVAAGANVASAAVAPKFVFRTFFTYTLQAPTVANKTAVVANLNASIYERASVVHPISWAFGPDLGLVPHLGYNTSNADVGGYLDFASLKDIEIWYAGLANTSTYQANLKLIIPSLTTRVQTLHMTGQDDFEAQQIHAVFAYQYPGAQTTGFILGQVTQVLANISDVGPSPPNNTFLEIDLGLHDNLYPTNPVPNFNFAGLFIFMENPDNIFTFYPWNVAQPQLIAIKQYVSSSFRIQFLTSATNTTYPYGVANTWY